MTNQPRIYRFLLRLCADSDTATELTQETLTRAWQRRSQLNNPDAMTTWLFRIAHNRFREHIRAQDQQRKLGWEPLEENSIAGKLATPEKLTSDQETGQQIWNAMNHLPPRQSQVLHLRIIEQLSTDEIAEVLEINAQAVRSNLSAAR